MEEIMSTAESLARENFSLAKENESLRDEVNRLKRIINCPELSSDYEDDSDKAKHAEMWRTFAKSISIIIEQCKLKRGHDSDLSALRYVMAAAKATESSIVPLFERS